MPRYLYQVSYTAESLATQIKSPRQSAPSSRITGTR